MTESPPPTAFLSQLSFQGKKCSVIATYPLMAPGEVVIGRDPRCQIVLDSQTYNGVSRQHAKIAPSENSLSGWEVCDLDSANGTFVNGQKIERCWNLRQGDRISLAHEGAEFVFQLQIVPDSVLPTSPSLRAAVPMTAVTPWEVGEDFRSGTEARSPKGTEIVTLSQLFPILSVAGDLTRKAYLVPGVLTVTFVVLMFVSIGNSLLFNLLLSAYIAGVAYYFVYQLCGKRKPWWVLVGSGLVTAGLLASPVLDLFVFVFRRVLPGEIPQQATWATIPSVLVQMFFGAGLMEEMLKSIPILLVYGVGRQVRSPWRERIGISEPLDGILVGTASAVGFTLIETLRQYVPNIVNDYTLQAGVNQAEVVGLQLLIARILGSIFGHMAYSGYLGYFFGLSVLKPRQRWQILVAGYLTASVLHALWNTTGMINLVVLALVGVTSYAFLMAAILKARALSPTRSENFATRFTRLR